MMETILEGNLSYKEKHESFISGHNGTSVLEISVVVSTMPLTLLLREVLLLKTSSAILSKSVFLLGIDFSLLVIPLIFNFTFLADHAPLLLTMCLLGLITILLQHSSFKSPKSAWKLVENMMLPERLPFITNYRAYVNLATAVCILAVDFAVFPRRFCKAETFGSGLMDVGVASFVISNAIVSPEARGKCTSARSIVEILQRLARSVRSTFPLWFLGFCRLLAVKGTDYHEHVTEYGVHWNFFFTLAVVRVLATLIMCVLSHKKAWLVALILAVFYETWLQFGLRNYMLFGADGTGSRIGLIDSNREGVYSIFGYLAVFFGGVQLGQFLLRPRQSFKSWLYMFAVLVVIDLILWVLLAICQDFVDPISRRLVNLSHIIWMLAYNVQSLAQLLAVDLVIFWCKQQAFSPKSGDANRDESSKFFHLLEAVNRNGLFYFLLANVLTGGINMLVDTLNSSPAVAICLISSYMLILSTLTAVLHLRNITVKFW